VRAIGSASDDPHSLIYLTLLSAIDNAEQQVHLTNAYFVPDPQLLKSLTDAAQRNVEVKLVLPSLTIPGRYSTPGVRIIRSCCVPASGSTNGAAR